MNYTLTPDQAQDIINIACESWQQKLAKVWAVDMVLKKQITVSSEFRSEMLKAATEKQYVVLLKMMPHLIPWHPGALYFVMSNTERVWDLRYASEKHGEFYVNQRKSGAVMTKTEYIPAEGITLPE